MREPVLAWLRAKGYVCAVEIMIACYCDIVGGLYGPRKGRARPRLLRAVAVELKLDDAGGVLNQAVMNRYCVSASYAAMPTERIRRMRPQTLLAFYNEGVGLLAVDSVVCEVFPAQLEGQINPLTEMRIWRRVRREQMETNHV